MRTYRRKRPQHQEIQGVLELCRLCLGKVDQAVPIFTDEVDSNLCGSLYLRIMICVGLEITREECVPNVICTGCFQELERFYSFRKKCEVTYQKLKSHIQAIKDKQCEQDIARRAQELMQAKEKNESSGGEHLQQLILTFNDNQQVELVNVVNIQGVQLNEVNNLEVLNNNKINDNTQEVSRAETLQNQVQMQDISTTNPSPSMAEIEASNTDMSLILSTILMELGVLTSEDNRLVVTDNTLTTIELEGNNTKIVLELCEEDEEQNTVKAEEEAGSNVTSWEESNDSLQQAESNAKIVTRKNKGKRRRSPGGPIECGLCGKRFVSRSVLARHWRVHSGERPYACPVCQRRFAQREVMARHRLVHDERRPHRCGQCAKSFTQRGALLAHARSHAPPAARPLRLHACPHCDKLFLYASGLSRHMISHSGRVYACGECGRGFSDGSSLLRHKRNTHKNITQEATPVTPAAAAATASKPT